jgi:superfamily II DNA or RNA helicase
MSKKAYNWQNTALTRFVRAAYFALVVDCGCGKTFAGIKIALGKMLPTIVIAPGHTLCAQWKEEILQVAGPDENVWVYDRNEERKKGVHYEEEFARWLKT